MTPSLAAADDRLRRPPARLRLLADERLAARVRDGDERAFEVLFQRHQPGVLSFCRYLLGSRDEAQDAVQQSFLRLHGALLRERPPAELQPFLYAIARNRCRSILAVRRDEAIVADVPDMAGLADEVQQRADLRELVADIERLPEEQRGALVLAEMGGLSHSGIAQVLEVPEARVRTLIYQAKAHLLAEREARERSCDDVRAELATATGAALRRGPLRRHLRGCQGCRDFKRGLARQQHALAIVLPVAAGGSLKGGLGALLGGGAAAAGGAAVAGSAGGGGLLAGLGAAKAVAVVVALGAGAVGGTAVVGEVRDDGPSVPAAVAPVQAAPPPVAATPTTPTSSPTPGLAGGRAKGSQSRGAMKPQPSAAVAPADLADRRVPRGTDPQRSRGGTQGSGPTAPRSAAKTLRQAEKRLQKAAKRVAQQQRRADRRAAKPERRGAQGSDPAAPRGRAKGQQAPPVTTTTETPPPAPAP